MGYIVLLFTKFWHHSIAPIINDLLSRFLGVELNTLLDIAAFDHVEYSPHQQYRANVIVFVALSTILLSIVLIMYGTIGFATGLIVITANRLLTLIAVPLIYSGIILFTFKYPWRNRINAMISVITISGLIAVSISTFFAGGLFATPIYGLIVVLATATLLMDLRTITVLFMAVVVYLFILLLGDIAGVLPEAPRDDLPVQAIAVIACVTILFLLLSYHKYAIQASERKLAKLQSDMVRFQTQRELTYNLTHDLRTPLSVLNSTSYILKKKLEKELPIDEQIDRFDAITAQMNDIITDLFELSRLDSESKARSLEKVNVRNIIYDVMNKQHAFANRKSIAVTFDDALTHDLHVLGNSTQLQQALNNVVENAILYGRANGAVEISLSQKDTSLVIAVADDGIGIPSEYHDRVFERFFKVNTVRTRDDNSGTGIGLTIAKRIIQLYGGDVTIDSQLDAGTTVSVLLPFV